MEKRRPLTEKERSPIERLLRVSRLLGKRAITISRFESVKILSRSALGACVFLIASPSYAQLNKTRDYKLHEPEDRGVLFAMTLAPDKSLFTLVAKKDGHWPLTRVGRWWGDAPTEQQVPVEGFSKRDPIDSFPSIKLLLSPDGRYLIAALEATVKTTQGLPLSTDMIINLLRLDQFRVVNTVHTKALGMEGYVDAGLDTSGRLIVRSTMNPQVRGEPRTQTWYTLSLPDLRASTACSYRLPAKLQDTQPMENACGQFAKDEKYPSATALERDSFGVQATQALPKFAANQFMGWRFLKTKGGDWIGMSPASEELDLLRDDGQKLHGFQPAALCAKQPVRGPAWICNCALLGGSEAALAISCETSHDNLLGLNVGLDQWIAAVDLEHEKDLGRISFPRKDYYQAKAVEIDDKPALLVVLNGSRLQVYSADSSKVR